MSGKIQVLNVFVNDDDGYVVYFRLAAGSDDVSNAGILWQLSCDDNAGGLSYLADDFAANAITPLDGTGAVTVAEAGVAYRTTIVADADPADNTDFDCGPDHLFSNNLRATLYFHVVGGGTTYDVLKVNDDSIGATVV
jgi:hypothetical protein